MRNLHQLFDWQYIGQITGWDFAKFCGLLRIYELYFNRPWINTIWTRFSDLPSPLVLDLKWLKFNMIFLIGSQRIRHQSWFCELFLELRSCSITTQMVLGRPVSRRNILSDIMPNWPETIRRFWKCRTRYLLVPKYYIYMIIMVSWVMAFITCVYMYNIISSILSKKMNGLQGNCCILWIDKTSESIFNVKNCILWV